MEEARESEDSIESIRPTLSIFSIPSKKGRKTVDRLELRGLEVACVIGDRTEERLREQTLTVDVSLSLDFSAVAGSDALCDTVDYVVLADAVRAALRQARCRMIERAAECVARVCLADPRVAEVRVRVEKPVVVSGLRAAAVEITRKRTEGAP